MSTITLITGSTLGGAEYVGDHLAEILTTKGHNVTIINNAQLSNITNNDRILLITSTHGAGDYPDNIAPLIEQLKQQSPDLSRLKYAVIAIGDSSYDTFCLAGRNIDALLEKLGATRSISRLDIDVLNHSLPEEPAEVWLSTLGKSFCE